MEFIRHKELLRAIEWAGATLTAFALIRVVELHKPRQHEVVSYVFCEGCTLDPDLAPPYPCETIKAIEKELGCDCCNADEKCKECGDAQKEEL